MALRSDPAKWTDARHLRGLQGEVVAEKFLERAGWRILEHRFRMGRLEIDLIARKGTVVAFVEVKTRLGAQFGSPAQAVTWHKQREIGRVAQAWVDRYGRSRDSYRFDVIAVMRPGTLEERVEHVPDAFRLSRR